MSVIQKDKSEEYNPFEHREVKKPNSDIRSLANLIKSSLGSGLLAVPLAFSNSGWAVGIVGTIVIAFVCTHCVHIFLAICVGRSASSFLTSVRSASMLRKHVLYQLISQALGELFRRKLFAEFSLCFTYIGVCCIFTVLIADSIKQLFDTYYPVAILPVQYYCLILLVPLCLMVQIRHLKYLAPFSLLANILLMATFAICLYYIFEGEISYSDKILAGDISRFPAFLSTVIFAMEGMGVVMPVENAMKKPQHFLGCISVLSIAMTVVCVLYGALGLFGYFKYGDVLRGSITLNLPVDDWPAICAKCFIAISILFTYPLHFFVVIDILSTYMKPYVKEKHRNLVQVVSRAAIVCFCGGIGIALPMLEQIINLVGALFYSILGLIIPGIVETIFRWEDLGRYNWVLWKNVLIIAFGLLALVSGCAVTILDIIGNLNSKTE